MPRRPRSRSPLRTEAGPSVYRHREKSNVPPDCSLIQSLLWGLAVAEAYRQASLKVPGGRPFGETQHSTEYREAVRAGHPALLACWHAAHERYGVDPTIDDEPPGRRRAIAASASAHRQPRERSNPERHPFDPFIKPNAGYNVLRLMEMREEVLERAEQDPQILADYPLAREYLDNLPPGDERRYILYEYEGRDRTPTPEPLEPELQDVHEDICRLDRSQTATLVLLMTSLIPKGSVTTYNKIRLWISDAFSMCSNRAVRAALRDSPYGVDVVPTHRVLRSGPDEPDGFDFGDHLHMSNRQRIDFFTREVPTDEQRHNVFVNWFGADMMGLMQRTPIKRYIERWPEVGPAEDSASGESESASDSE